MIKKLSVIAIIMLAVVSIVGCSSDQSSVEFSYDDYMENIKGQKTVNNTESANTSSGEQSSLPIITLTPDSEFKIEDVWYYYNGMINKDTLSFQRYVYDWEDAIQSYYHAEQGSEFIFKQANVKAKILEMNASTGQIALELSLFE